VNFGFLEMRLKGLLELHIVRMLNHVRKALKDLVFGRKQVTKLRGVECLKTWKIVGS
jgi:hypothetical protein